MSVYEKERERKERNRQERREEERKRSSLVFHLEQRGKKSILTMVTEKKKVQMNTICPARN